jgi:tetratricopeptide (TPR) repeat protein
MSRTLKVLLLSGQMLAVVPAAAAQPGAPSADLPPVSRASLAHREALGPDGLAVEQAIANRRWDDAAGLLAAAIERAPRSFDLLTLLGRVFMMAGRPLNAAVAFKKAETLGPLDTETRFSLALAYIAMGRGDWAQPELERLWAVDKSRPVFLYWLGRLDYDAGRYASALTRFQQVIAADPLSVRAHDNLGLCYDAQHEPALAIASHSRAVELNRRAPTRSPWPPLNLGVLYRQRSEWEEAEALLREAVDIDSTLGQAHYELGTVLEARGAVESAFASLRAAAAAAPSYPEPHYALARILRRLGRYRDAEEAMATFLKLRDARADAR